jgi:hypothetical protein
MAVRLRLRLPGITPGLRENPVLPAGVRPAHDLAFNLPSRVLSMAAT